MADIVGSLFGVAPQAVQASITNPMFERAAAFAQMDPMQRAQFGIYSGGAMLGQGIGGLLGGEDPRLVQARQMQQVKDYAAKNNINVNTVEGINQLAQYANSIGATEGAIYLGQMGQKMKAQGLEQRQTELNISKTEEDYNREKAFREAVAALPMEERTEENIMQLASQFGTTATVMSALANLTGKREALAARQAAADEKAAAKREAQEEKTTKAKQAALAGIGPVIDAIETAIPQVGPMSAGLGGAIMGTIWGTTARDLEANVQTVVANLGFQQLQAMREASPTGGALGQVAVKELEALQSVVANLKRDQSPKQLRDNLEKVKLHYNNWKKTLEGDLGIGQPIVPAAGAAVDNDPLGIRTRR